MELAAYEATLPEKWRDSYFSLKESLLTNLPEGFELIMQYGMPTFVVPLSTFPQGYLGRKNEPLPFLSLAAQKNHLALYHMGLMSNKELLTWFQTKYAEAVPTKLNMGKSCIRFTNTKHIPYKLIGELAQKITVTEWIEAYMRYQKK
ncbi:DUF1801 domain-containing protein [Enterococcus songbeiensis]|uniref:DUF1801 domain-containing protein n=1 Tax=Enterococcus songbeiensis TaxID=2559927 RepID=UPI0010F57564|nr:DUF1801 domain-containing protein [Enterococcus songbeiensis]